MASEDHFFGIAGCVGVFVGSDSDLVDGGDFWVGGGGFERDGSVPAFGLGMGGEAGGGLAFGEPVAGVWVAVCDAEFAGGAGIF